MRKEDPAFGKIVVAGLGAGFSFMMLGVITIISTLMAINSSTDHRLNIQPAVQAASVSMPSSPLLQIHDGRESIAQKQTEGLQLGITDQAALMSPEVELPEMVSKAVLEDNDEIDFMIALSLFNEENFRGALEHFSTLADNSGSMDYQLRSRFYCGECLFRLGNLDQAILQYQEAIALDNKHELATKALLQQANAFAELGNFKLSDLILRRLVQKYPASVESSIAAVMLRTNSPVE